MINIHEAKTHLSKILERVRAGEEIVLAKGGVPCARLVPIEANEKGRKPGLFKSIELIDFFEPMPEYELALWSGGSTEMSVSEPASKFQRLLPAGKASAKNKRPSNSAESGLKANGSKTSDSEVFSSKRAKSAVKGTKKRES
jgi:prevent-host-death family protein